jgi:hypothetical protein
VFAYNEFGGDDARAVDVATVAPPDIVVVHALGIPVSKSTHW